MNVIRPSCKVPDDVGPILGTVVCLAHDTLFCSVHPCNSRFPYAHCKESDGHRYSFTRVRKSINIDFPLSSLPSTYFLLAFAPLLTHPPPIVTYSLLFFHLSFRSRLIIAFDRREVCSTGRLRQVGRLLPASPVLYIALTRV